MLPHIKPRKSLQSACLSRVSVFQDEIVSEEFSSSVATDSDSEFDTILYDQFRNALENNLRDLLHRSIDETQFGLFKSFEANNLNRHINNSAEFEEQFNRRQLELENFLSITNILVGNIKAVDRNIQRKITTDYLNIYNKILIDIEAERDDTKKQYMLIMRKLEKLKKKSSYGEAFEDIYMLKQKTDEIIESKDELIKMCRAQLQVMNHRLAVNVSKYESQLMNFFERLEALRKLVENAYANHLEVIHLHIAQEHSKRLRSIQKNVQELFNRFAMTREKLSGITREKYAVFTNNIERMSLQQRAITKATLHRQDTIFECVQMELIHLKTENTFNWEKLEWNYMVLKSREEESHIILNQQKRRIHNMVDSIRTLRNILKNAKETGQGKMTKLQNSIERLHSTISATEKYNQFRNTKLLEDFISMWHLNDNEAQQELSSIMNIDRILYEQVLNIKWLPRSFDIKPIQLIADEKLAKIGKKQERSSTQLSIEASPCTSSLCYSISNKSPRTDSIKKRPNISDEKKRQVRFLRNVLRQIADSAGNIVEQKLLQIISMTSEKTKSLIRVEYIFNMLQVNDTKDLQVLAEIFKAYAKCPYCSTDVSPELLKKFCIDNEIENFSIPKRKDGKCPNHILLVEPSAVLIALRDFKENFKRLKSVYKAKKKTEAQKNILELLPKKDEIQSYWNDVISFIPKATVSLWRTLEHYQMNYYSELKLRKKLQNECKSLRQQNFQLRFLLGKQG